MSKNSKLRKQVFSGKLPLTKGQKRDLDRKLEHAKTKWSKYGSLQYSEEYANVMHRIYMESDFNRGLK